MDRRTALKQLSMFGGAMLVAPSCTFSSQRVSVALENLNISPAQETLLADIVDTFIPETDIPGASALKIHHFVLVMVDDCRDQADREIFEQGLGQLDILADRQHGSSFSECSRSEKENLLSGIMGESDTEMSKFLGITKQYTVQGFLQSKFVMTEIDPYQLVPGHFDGCVTI